MLAVLGVAVVVAYGTARRRVGARAICAGAAVIGAGALAALLVVGLPYSADGLDCGAAFHDPERKVLPADGAGPDDPWFDRCVEGARARRGVALVVLLAATVPAALGGAAVEDAERGARRSTREPVGQLAG